MAQLDLQRSRIKFKIVYYGPGLCGKTTNLERLHAATHGACELVTLNTDGDRTLFFDYMPLGFGRIDGIETVFKVYTVPGHVQYNRTRQTVLRDVDGIVFVADSRRAAIESNVESLANLSDNLAEAGNDFAALPLIFQYNKRDLDDILSIDELENALNDRRARSFAASAVKGDGVEETFAAIADEVYRFGVLRYGLSPIPEFNGLLSRAERPQYRSSIPPLGADAADDWRSIASSRPPFGPARGSEEGSSSAPPPGNTPDGSTEDERAEFERKMFTQIVEVRRMLEQLAMTAVDREDLGEVEIEAAEAQRYLADRVAQNTRRLEELSKGAANLERAMLDLREAIARDVRREIHSYVAKLEERETPAQRVSRADVDRHLADYLGVDLEAEDSGSQLALELVEDEPEPQRREITQRFLTKETQPPPRRRMAGGRYTEPDGNG